MENKINIDAIVKTPSKDRHARKGYGFSLSEIKEAGKSISMLKKMRIKIDYMRKTLLEENVKALKALKPPEQAKIKRAPFVRKEKKKRPFKPKMEKTQEKIEEKVEEIPKKVKNKQKAKSKKQEKQEIEQEPIKEEAQPMEHIPEPIEEKIELKSKEILIMELPGLGATTAKKFKDIGITSVEELCQEDPKELSKLVKGCSEDKIRKWIEEGKKLLK